MKLYKKPSKPIYYLTTVVFLLVLTACSPGSKQTSIDCSVDANQCLQINSDNTRIWINTQVVIVENLYQLTVNSTKQIEEVKLQGVNMNMGVIPLVMEPVDSDSADQFSYRADMFLGMCAEPQMQWMMTVTMTDGSSENLFFNAYWTAP